MNARLGPYARRAAAVFGAVLVVSCCGCVVESTNGDVHTYYNALWASAACFFGGIAATVAGWYLRPVSDRLGWGMMIAGVLAALGGTPTIFFEKTTIDNEGFFVRSGMWGMSSYDVKYANTTNIELISEEKRGRRGSRSTHYYLLCSQKTGEAQKVPVSGVCEEAFERIVISAAMHNVPFADSTGGF